MAHRFSRFMIVAGAVLLSALGLTRPAAAATAYGLTTANTLIVFDTATPGTVVRTIPISFTNFFDGETVLAISTPQNGFVFGLGKQHLYSIRLTNGAAFVHKVFSTPLTGNAFGLSVHPIEKTLRVVSDTGENLRFDFDGNSAVDTSSSSARSIGRIHRISGTKRTTAAASQRPARTGPWPRAASAARSTTRRTFSSRITRRKPLTSRSRSCASRAKTRRR